LGELYDFDELKARYIIEGELETKTQLHIGAGNLGLFSSIDNEFIRINKGGKELPYIPGSTIKGILRSMVEMILRRNGNVCYPYPEAICDDENSICDVCYLFGGKHNASRIQVMDAIPEDENQVVMRVKTGIAIDRVTGAARRGALYEVETVQPGSKFNFKMILENLDLEGNDQSRDENEKRRINALKWVLKELLDGNVYIGGKISTGLGRVKLVNARVKKLNLEKLEYEDIGELKSII